MVDSNNDESTDGGIINQKSVNDISNNSPSTRVNLQRITKRDRNTINRSKNRQLDKEALDRVNNSVNPENLDSETKRRSKNRIKSLNNFKNFNNNVKKRRQSDKAFDEKCKSDARRRSQLCRDRKKAAKKAAAKKYVDTENNAGAKSPSPGAVSQESSKSDKKRKTRSSSLLKATAKCVDTENNAGAKSPSPDAASQESSKSDKKRKTRSSSLFPKNKVSLKDKGSHSKLAETSNVFSFPSSVALPVATLLPTIEVTNTMEPLSASATTQVINKGNTTSPVTGSSSISEKTQSARKTLQEFTGDLVTRRFRRYDSSSRSHQFDREGLTEEQCEAVASVQNDLELWGMTIGTDASDKIVNCLKDEFKIIESSSFSIPKPVGLPNSNVFDAFRFLLENEIHTTRTKFGIIRDQLHFRTRNGLNEKLSIVEHDRELYGRPYKKDRSGNISLREGFGAVSLYDVLEPFDRFKWIRLSKRESFYESFVTNKNTLGGYVFETMVAWKMEHSNVKCKSCKTANLKWSGGSDSPWMDVVCTHCNSTYEIKSRRTCTHGFHQMRNGKLEGGSFSSFGILEKHFRNSVQTRHYCVVVGRESINNTFYRASVGMISKVLPIVNTKTFDSNRTEPAKFKSVIMMKGFQDWMQIPVENFERFEFSSWSQIAEKSFNNHFNNDQSSHQD